MAAKAEPDLPDVTTRRVCRVHVELGELLDAGVTPAGHRRIVPITGGHFEGPELAGTVLAGGADWQIVRPDGSIAVEARYTLQTDAGELLLVDARGVRHGPPDVLARLGRGEGVAPGEYTFRTAVSLETSAPALVWASLGVFVAVAARLPGAVVYDLYLVA